MTSYDYIPKYMVDWIPTKRVKHSQTHSNSKPDGQWEAFLPFVHDACRLWAFSWRFLRDMEAQIRRGDFLRETARHKTPWWVSCFHPFSSLSIYFHLFPSLSISFHLFPILDSLSQAGPWGKRRTPKMFNYRKDEAHWGSNVLRWVGCNFRICASQVGLGWWSFCAWVPQCLNA